MTRGANKPCIPGCVGHARTAKRRKNANAALLQQVRDLQGQFMAGQATLQEAESAIHWQQRQISQLQEELRMHGELQEDLEEELQTRSSEARSSEVLRPINGSMDAIYDAMAFAQHEREREASHNFW